MKFVEIAQMDTSSWVDPKLLVVFSTSEYKANLAKELREQFPALRIVQIRSFRGVITMQGFNWGAFAILWEASDGLYFDAVLTDLAHTKDATHRELAKQVATRFLPNFDKTRDLVMMCSTPGHEERIIEGVQDVLGADVPIFGGTAAPLTFQDANHYVALDEHMTTQGFGLMHIRSGRELRGRIIGRYRPSAHRGTVTKSKGRVIYEINHKPALTIYNQWRNMRVDLADEMAKATLLESMPYTLGHVGKGNAQLSMDDNWIAAVYEVDEKTQSIITLSEIREGEEVVLLEANDAVMIERLDYLIDSLSQGKSMEQLEGAVIIYCAGCVDRIGTNLDRLSDVLRNRLGDKPCIGLASLGEQGRMGEGTCSYHGNAMCAALLVFR